MAETLGSLVDKLTIKDLREYNLNERLGQEKDKSITSQIRQKLELLKKQKLNLLSEIESFVIAAAKGKIILRDEKLKLYNPLESIGKIPKCNKLGEAISFLAQKNAQLWHLEDEARRKDKGLAYVGSIKRKIDLANQQRNDLIDKIDELFEKKVQGRRK
jgi:hypothetical protein